MLKIGIQGATGRMGRLIIQNLQKDSEALVSVIHTIEEVPKELYGIAPATSSVDELLKNSEVVIDFSTPEGTQALIEGAMLFPRPLVIGSTGMSSFQLELIKKASLKMPILYSTNMSLGIALLNKLVKMTSSTLSDFDIEIIEYHHRHKKDSPSGTAITLGENAASGRNLDFNKVVIHGRNGIVGERSKDEIAVMALRGGDIVGRHTVGFYHDGEFVELHHTATNRNTFAIGAIKAAKWLVSQPNNLYTISDCLGLN